jgi:hypothetical protein
MYDVEAFKKLYPEMFPPTRPTDIIIGVIILSFLFIIRILKMQVFGNPGSRI